MFDWVLNTPFLYNANQLTGFYLIHIFIEKFSSKQAIKIWILIPIFPQNMFKFRAKNLHEIWQNMTKKSTQKLSLRKEILSWMIWDFSVQRKHFLTCPGLFRLIFLFLYHISLISPRREIDGVANFRHFCKLFTNKFAAFFVASCHSIFKWGKRNEVTGHMKHAAMVITCTLGSCTTRRYW